MDFHLKEVRLASTLMIAVSATFVFTERKEDVQLTAQYSHNPVCMLALGASLPPASAQHGSLATPGAAGPADESPTPGWSGLCASWQALGSADVWCHAQC